MAENLGLRGGQTSSQDIQSMFNSDIFNYPYNYMQDVEDSSPQILTNGTDPFAPAVTCMSNDHNNLRSTLEDVTSAMCDSTRLHMTGGYHETSQNANMVILNDFPVMSSPVSEATSSYPATNDYPGEYNFEILLDGTGSGFKAWMYSYELNKVFIDIGKVLPIQVKLFYKPGEPSQPLFLRATPIYSQDDFRGIPVERCPLHVSPENKINEGFKSFVKHIVRCTSVDSQYPFDEGSGRYSCVCPLAQPTAGSDTVTLMYSFVCKTSCLGGMDRRPVLLLLTLENEVGQILGRRSLSVKVCACPKRDKEKEEKEAQNCGGARRTAKGRKRSLETTQVKQEVNYDMPDTKKFCSETYNLSMILSDLPPDHKYYLMNSMSIFLFGMFARKGNEACRLAAEKCAIISEKIKSESEFADTF